MVVCLYINTGHILPVVHSQVVTLLISKFSRTVIEGTPQYRIQLKLLLSLKAAKNR